MTRDMACHMPLFIDKFTIHRPHVEASCNLIHGSRFWFLVFGFYWVRGWCVCLF